ncbi:MAG: polyhydroxybutyrate depolymerase [Herpetosiphonaceae bacterium]|nr:polyhydroxybutyrate depolymerase [Herpetosiphonaceae bacterium]
MSNLMQRPERSLTTVPVRRRALTIGGAIVGASALAVAAVYRYFAYAPSPVQPTFNAEVVKDRITIDGRERTYTAIIPRALPAGAPLLFVFHGSLQDADGMRVATGYGFDTLAEQERFIVIYPNGYKGNWHDCRTAADYPARTENIDDNGLVLGLIARFHDAYGIDRARVFAAGYSNGGQLVFRFAAEMPERFAGLAAIAATQPTPDNFECDASGRPVPMLLMSGTRDPIAPYNGGVISLFGFKPRGTALSALETARHFAQINSITAPPTTSALDHRETSGDTRVTLTTYAEDNKDPVIVYTIMNGGHVVPNPIYSAPRLVGRTTHDVDAPRAIWTFFAGLPPRPQR